jgi:hypothetical protein
MPTPLAQIYVDMAAPSASAGGIAVNPSQIGGFHARI